MLTRKEAYEVFDTYAQNSFIVESPDYEPVSKDKYSDMYDLYVKSAQLDIFVSGINNPTAQETILYDIYHGIASGRETYADIWDYYSTNKHMDYYDSFLYEGATKEIKEVLLHAGVNSEILKRIRKMQPDAYRIDQNGHSCNVIQEIEHPPGGSPYISLFQIYVDGKLIFTFKSNSNEQFVFKIDEQLSYVASALNKDINILKRQRKNILKIEKRDNGQFIAQTLMRNGMTAYRDLKTGRFTKKS